MKNLIFLFCFMSAIVHAQEAKTIRVGASGVGHFRTVSCSLPSGGGLCTTDDPKAAHKEFYINYSESYSYEYNVTTADDCDSYKFNKVGKKDLFVSQANETATPGFDAFTYMFDQPGTIIVYQVQSNGVLTPIKYSCVSN